MHIHLEASTSHSIQAYSNNAIRIQAITYEKNFIISNCGNIVCNWEIQSLEQLHNIIVNHEANQLKLLLQSEPEIIIIGSEKSIQNSSLVNLPPIHKHDKHYISVESMSIGAACRTFNILLNENRAVVMGIIFTLSVPNKAKLLWNCRRGMLELDLILQDFVASYIDESEVRDLLTLEQLLTHDDRDLYSWLIEQLECPYKELAEIVKRIKLHRGLR